MEKVDTLVVDKTGTLTEGKPKVLQISAIQPHTEDEVLRLAATLEKASEHPYAAAIVNAASSRGFILSDPNRLHIPARQRRSRHRRRPAGRGGQSGAHGGSGHLRCCGGGSDGTGTRLGVAINGKYAGSLVLADPVKASTPDALRDLKRQGIRIQTSTGDSRDTAAAIAHKSAAAG